ncbi:MAG: cellulase family glycosylhydrolase, partial [Bacteroidetes bacterium]|nr:cellulase family glycosylhydrolase [Bacteroidota bacterium]
MRINLKKLVFIFSFFLLLLSEIKVNGQEQDDNLPAFQKELNQKFKAGVNISYFENYWKKEDYLLSNYKKVMSKIELANKLGFTSVRLPVAFDNFLVSGTNTINKDLINELVEIYDYVEKRNMNLIITYHYGTLFKKENKVKEVERIADMWSQIIFDFKGRGYDRLYFGLYNEPRVSVEDWRFAKNQLMKILRPKDLDRYWIVGSTNYNGIDAMIQLKKVPNDNKVIYTFHFYQPYIFTHQGASWDPDKTYLKVLPYPYTTNEMPAKPNRSMTRDMDYNYEHYSEKASQNFIAQRLKIVYDWMIENQVPVICTETGTIASVPKQYRDSYFKDVFYVMNWYGIPAMIWDLDQTFKIVEGDN